MSLKLGIQISITARTGIDLANTCVPELFYQGSALALGNCYQSHDGYGKDGEGGDEPAEKNAPPWVGVGTTIV